MSSVLCAWLRKVLTVGALWVLVWITVYVVKGGKVRVLWTVSVLCVKLVQFLVSSAPSSGRLGRWARTSMRLGPML